MTNQEITEIWSAAVVRAKIEGRPEPIVFAESLLAARDELESLRERETLAQYPDSGGGRRVWQSVGAWLYPVDEIAVIRKRMASDE